MRRIVDNDIKTAGLEGHVAVITDYIRLALGVDVHADDGA